MKIRWGILVALSGVALAAYAFAADKKPNILVIWGDDIGQFNIFACNRGMMGYQTPNIDSLAKQGALFTDWYGQQSCTAGRAAFSRQAVLPVVELDADAHLYAFEERVRRQDWPRHLC